MISEQNRKPLKTILPKHMLIFLHGDTTMPQPLMILKSKITKIHPRAICNYLEDYQWGYLEHLSKKYFNSS